MYKSFQICIQYFHHLHTIFSSIFIWIRLESLTALFNEFGVETCEDLEDVYVDSDMITRIQAELDAGDFEKFRAAGNETRCLIGKRLSSLLDPQRVRQQINAQLEKQRAEIEQAGLKERVAARRKEDRIEKFVQKQAYLTRRNEEISGQIYASRLINYIGIG